MYSKTSKRRFRRLSVAIAIACSLALIAAACGDDDDDSTPAVAEPAAEAPTPTTEAPATTMAEPAMEPTSVGMVYDIGGRGDKSFNDAAAAGLDRADGDFDLDPAEASPLDDGSNRENLLQLQADRAELVLGIGFLFADSMKKVAADNPDICFGIIDSTVDDATGNIAQLVFSEHEGSFLVGAAAALKSQTGMLGFIGGVNMPLIQRFHAGFQAGARAVNPDVEIISSYLSEPPDYSGWNQPGAAKISSQSFYEQGADIVYHAAGGAGNGVFEAAKEFSESSGSKVWAIGVDSDQYNEVEEDVREYILTSMLKRVDVAVYETIRSVVNGTCPGGVRSFALVDDGVGYSTTGGFLDDIQDQLEDYKARVISGEITVPDTL